MTENDIARIIANYDTQVQANNAVAAVVEDPYGEVTGEVIDTAEHMGYQLDDADVSQLATAASGYRAALAAKR